MRILAFSGAVLSCWVGCASAQSQTPLPDIIAQLQQEQHKLRSATAEGIEATQTMPDFSRFYHLDLPANAVMSPPQQNIPSRWAFKDDKRFREYTELGPPKGPNERHQLTSLTNTVIYDGKQTFHQIASHYTGLKEPALSGGLDQKDLHDDVTPLSFGYQLNDQWLADVLQNGDFQPCGVLSDPTWGQLEGYSENKQVQYGTQRTAVWLARGYHWLMVRSESDCDTTFQGHRLHILMSSELEKAEQRDGVWFPTQGTVKAYGIENGQKMLISTRAIQVNSFTLNDTPDSLFEIKFQPGLAYTDVATQQFFHIGPNGEKINIDLHGQDRVPQHLVGWVFMLSATTLLCLGMGVLWRKQKRGLSV